MRGERDESTTTTSTDKKLLRSDHREEIAKESSSVAGSSLINQGNTILQTFIAGNIKHVAAVV